MIFITNQVIDVNEASSMADGAGISNKLLVSKYFEKFLHYRNNILSHFF